MANGREHLLIGVPFGLGCAFLPSEGQSLASRVLETFGGVWGARLGAVCPDRLDLPTSSHHRGFAHAVVPALGMGRVALTVQEQLRSWAHQHALQGNLASSPAIAAWHSLCELVLRFFAGALVGFVAAYGSHLALDLATPRGLPLVS